MCVSTGVGTAVVVVRAPVRFSEAGERVLSADPAPRVRGGGRTGTRRRRDRRSPCRNLSGRRRRRHRGRGGRRRTANLTGGPTRESGRPPTRSGRVSGMRPSDRRGPGPVGHRGRNVRSIGRCSYNLRITRHRAASCDLHRSTSRVIRRSGCVRGVFFRFSSRFSLWRKPAKTKKNPT